MARAKSMPAPPIPPLRGRSVALQPVTPNDYGILQLLETNNELALNWRYRGQTPSPEQWMSTLWSGVLAQFIVVAEGADVPVGLVLAYRHSFQDQHAYIAGLRFDPDDRTPRFMRGIALFLQYVFGSWEFRKLYLETPSYNLPQFASGLGSFFEVEARLKDHYTYAGQHWDLVTLAVYRERWQEQAARVLETERVQKPTRVAVHFPAETTR
ncbi:hypothetical protein DSM104299_05279 [Baekduia alba]|nr:hypothetical protein DSM104299_05279 [Baekduia alba]